MDSSRAIEAIEKLTSRNREKCSIDLEEQLVGLRTEAGLALRSEREGTGVGRPDYADCFTSARGLPEIQGSELSEFTLAGGILHHGGLLVRGLYTEEQLQRLEQLAAREEEANRADTGDLGCTAHTLYELLEIYRECGLLDAARGYLGEDILLFGERAKLRHHRAGRDRYAAIPWHQDANFFGRKSYGINCWAAVTSCGALNPGLSIVPRRTEQRLGWDEDAGIAPLDYGRSLAGGLLEQFSGDRAVAHPVLAPGDALLFDEMTVHQTASKRWEKDEQIVTISWLFSAAGFPGWGTPLLV